ncbi:MAG: CDP-glucose 4,6-dehydratase [Planctomycetaceae bacterium]|jgi:CDP-glucose 4,6-dehydratase|nr:CDP-glucose 4,6-dehydratase [Planctomycetaceae bacterium]
MQFDNIYNNRRIFLTGHTGFKGSWLTAWLLRLNAKICGFSLDTPSNPNHFSLLQNKIADCRGDIRDFNQLNICLREFEPEIVFHLAAQPIVRLSYDEPLRTFDTNIMGTANLLEACRNTPSVQAALIITTDKCYENKEWIWGYRENDHLGGHDPYSASKACAEIITSSFRSSFADGRLFIATCRAGNVIGGGDWANDRLIPDLIRAATTNNTITLRMPNAIRPWQHVLEPLQGYLTLGQKLLEKKNDFAEAWNFGPDANDNLSVENITKLAAKYWNKIKYNTITNNQNQYKHEAVNLILDNAKAKRKLNWKPKWSLEKTIEKTITWYKNYYEKNQIQTLKQIEEYINS